jgi:peptidoglycan/LPS O-acetylase OafA/YrhL
MGKRSYTLLTGVGERSYSIYLLHFPLFLLCWGVCKVVFYNTAFRSDIHYGIAQLLTFIIIGGPIIELVYRYVELPWIEHGRKINSNNWMVEPL